MWGTGFFSEDGFSHNKYFVSAWFIDFIPSRAFRVSQELDWSTMLTEFFCTQVLQLMGICVGIPHPHVCHIRLSTEEGFKWGFAANADCSIYRIYSCSKCLSPKELWGPCIFHDGASLVKDFPVRPFGDAVLLGGVGYGEFYTDSIFITVTPESVVNILSSTI